MARLALVTGGAGFIGSHLVEGLLKQGYRVRVLDDFSTGHDRNLAHIVDQIEVIRGSCCIREDVRRAVDGAELVYHEAGLASVQASVEDPVGSHQVNLEGTLIMLEEARHSGVERFVFAGSSAVYGDSPDLPKIEQMRPDPLSPYAAQKLAAEIYCRVFAHCYEMSTVVLRYFNVFGPRQDPSSPYSGVISLFIKALGEGQAPTIYGDGEQTRDFIYVHDVVQANLLAARDEVSSGSVLNVAAGQQITVNQLFEVIRDSFGDEVSGLEAIHGPARPGDILHSVADISEARRVLEYEPKTSVVDGLRQTVEHWCKEIRT